MISYTLNIVFPRGLLSAYGSYQKYYETNFLLDTPSTSIAWVGTLQGVLLICTCSSLIVPECPESRRSKDD